MRIKRFAFFVLATVLTAGALTLVSCLPQLKPPPVAGDRGGPPAVGDPAPEVALKELATGEVVNIPGDLAGRPFALLFFSYG